MGHVIYGRGQRAKILLFERHNPIAAFMKRSEALPPTHGSFCENRSKYQRLGTVVPYSTSALQLTGELTKYRRKKSTSALHFLGEGRDSMELGTAALLPRGVTVASLSYCSNEPVKLCQHRARAIEAGVSSGDSTPQH